MSTFPRYHQVMSGRFRPDTRYRRYRFIDIKKHVADGQPSDVWQYHHCVRIDDPRPVPFKVILPGVPLDYTDTTFGAVVLSERLAGVFANIAGDDIQLLPADVEGVEGEGQWKVMNVLANPDCIDLSRSRHSINSPDHRFHPNLPGGFTAFVIDPARAGGHHILRPKLWEVAVVVSERIKDEMEKMEALGAEFRLCT
jgi:hypothetical protein